jgi:hypothetical protein
MFGLALAAVVLLAAIVGGIFDATGRVGAALACKPDVRTATTLIPGTDGKAAGMRVSVTAAAQVPGGDLLSRIAFTSAAHAQVEVHERPIATPATITVEPPVASWSFVVRGLQAGQPFTVSFVATDRCGSVTKFVGAGEAAARSVGQPRPTPTPAPTAKTFHVSPSGSDSDDGLSPSTAWRTFANVRAGRVEAGSKILAAAGGAWNETVRLRAAQLKLGVYGTGPRPTIVAPDGAYALDASGFPGIEVDGWEFTSSSRRGAQWGIVRMGGDDYVVRRVVVHGADGHMFHASGARGLVEDSELYDNHASGPQSAVVISGHVASGYPDPASATIFRNNHVHDTSYRALSTWGTNIRVENNLIERWTSADAAGNATQAPAGIYLAGRFLGDVVVTHNRVLGSGVEYWGIWVDTGPEHRAIIENNEIADATRCFWAEKTDNVIFRHNTCSRMGRAGVQWGSNQWDPEDAADDGQIYGNAFVGPEPADGWIKIQTHGSATIGVNSYVP